MESDNEELKKINKEIIKLNIIGFPGAVFLGFGLFGLFEKNAANLHSLFGHQKFVYLLLIAGTLIEVWQFIKILPLLKKRISLAKNEKDEF